MTTLSDGTITIALNDALQWTDEFTWAPVEQATARSVTGALIVQAAARVAGRPVTLAADSEDAGWISRGALRQLQTLAAVPGKTLTLTLRSTAYSVIFRHQDTALGASPVIPWAPDDLDDTDPYRVVIRLMVIA